MSLDQEQCPLFYKIVPDTSHTYGWKPSIELLAQSQLHEKKLAKIYTDNIG